MGWPRGGPRQLCVGRSHGEYELAAKTEQRLQAAKGSKENVVGRLCFQSLGRGPLRLLQHSVSL